MVISMKKIINKKKPRDINITIFNPKRLTLCIKTYHNSKSHRVNLILSFNSQHKKYDELSKSIIKSIKYATKHQPLRSMKK